MENNTHNVDRGDNSNTIFGTSSDDIVQGLHSGAFRDLKNESDRTNPDDSEMIVNEQEQNEIVNPAEEEFTEQPLAESTDAATAKEKQDGTKDEIDGELIDDGIDNEEDIKKTEN